jgi:abortive infection bacteriophage resistance protein
MRPTRADTFIEGARFEDAVALCLFDHHLRLCLLDALQQIEIAMRVQIGYQLGKADPFGHLHRESLDLDTCAQPGRDSASELDAHDDWLTMFDALRSDSRHEDYVKHFTLKYDGEMPVWVATELMTFGCLTYLYHLLSHRDADKIAANLGIRDRDLVHKWLKALNVLRNHCARNARIWNRSTVYPPKKPPANLTHERLHHLRAADPNKLYFLAALIAHLVVSLRPASNWPRQFKTRMRKFPEVNGMTPQNSMGFVGGWDELPLWNYDPPSS